MHELNEVIDAEYVPAIQLHVGDLVAYNGRVRKIVRYDRLGSQTHIKLILVDSTGDRRLVEFANDDNVEVIWRRVR